MRYVLVRFIALCIALMTLPCIVDAQEVICDTELSYCQLGPTIYSKTTTLFNPPNQCTVTIYYRTANNCPGMQAVEIRKIEVQNPCNSSFTAKDYVSWAIKNLLAGPTNGLNPLPPGGCQETWMAVFSGCWKEVDAGWLKIVVPCGITCCWGRYRICGTTSGVNTVALFGLGNGDEWMCDDVDPSCTQPVCPHIYVPW